MFITFEGIDGSGKTTQIEILKEKLVKQGHSVEVFREPGGTIISEKVRELLLKEKYEVHPITELLLFSAARAQLTAKKILPLLEKNVIVILDRFYDSTLAYQGFGRQLLNEAAIKKINAIATQNLIPDLTFYLQISFDEAQKRTQTLTGDRMEQSGEAFFKRVLKGYEKLTEQENRFIPLDSTQPVQQTHSRIMRIVKPFL